ncbi:hypothetical protein O181_086027 [Austropuccinia psidii MF-1]|uniref:Integrase catalytic domain-containing protein n=1 Tax=Austropuccinia psidii MF-1 TaxID=1389203 RepID=A0A9Q3IM54_9BASI|nr:hypothetical protein [Austropuccinia psidii MF-1]
MENQKDRKIKRIVSDRGEKFLKKHFKDLSEECGITHILSPTETPQHNGYAERVNRTILEKTRFLLGSASLPDSSPNKAPQDIWVSCLYCQSQKPPHLEDVASRKVYLHIPQGLELNEKRRGLRLKKEISGLKQAPLAWYECLKEWLVGANFQACILETCVFHQSGIKPIWLYLHVNDIAVFGNEISKLKEEISLKFQIKDLGPADLLLGVKITQEEDCIYLDQQHFCESLLSQYGMSKCKPTSTPLVPTEQLAIATQDKMEKLNLLRVSSCSAIGSINYLSTATRPDLSFAVSSLSQYLENTVIKHWHAFLHVLRYLKGSSNIGLRYKQEEAQGISAWSDADWGNCGSTRCSVTGYLATLNNSLVLWKTRKKPLASISTAEAEYKALCNLTSELIWLKQWCAEA